MSITEQMKLNIDLILAVVRGSIEDVQKAVKKGADCYYENAEAAKLCIYNNRLDLFTEIVNDSFDVYFNRCELFYSAAKVKNTDAFRHLISQLEEGQAPAFDLVSIVNYSNEEIKEMFNAAVGAKMSK